MHKYNVGDMIHILPKDRLGRPEHFDFAGVMYQYCDRVAKIVEIGGSNHTFKIDIDKQRWHWHRDNIEPATQVYIPEIHELTSFL